MKETTRPNKKIIYILKAIIFCTIFIGIFIILSFTKSSVSDKFERITHGIIGSFAALLTTFLFVNFDKKTFADIGLKFEKNSFQNFILGVLAGIRSSIYITSILFALFHIVNGRTIQNSFLGVGVWGIITRPDIV